MTNTTIYFKKKIKDEFVELYTFLFPRKYPHHEKKGLLSSWLVCEVPIEREKALDRIKQRFGKDVKIVSNKEEEKRP